MGIHIGVDLGGTKVRIVSNTPDQLDAAVGVSGLDFTPQMLRQQIEDYCTTRGMRPDTIGIAVPGLIQAPQILQCDDLPHFSKTDGSALGIPGVPVSILNDLDAGLLDVLSNLPSSATCLLVMVGTTVGTSLAVKGVPFNGACGFAGELGYFPVMEEGELTRLDKIAGGRYIISKLGASPEQITAEILQGNQKYISVMNHAGKSLGRVISGIMSFINPSHVVVGGGTLRYPGYFESMQKEIESTCLDEILNACTISKAASGKNVVAKGALLAGKRMH